MYTKYFVLLLITVTTYMIKSLTLATSRLKLLPPPPVTLRCSDGLLPSQRPPHDTPDLSSRTGSPRLCHQSGAHGREAPDALLFHHHLLLCFFLLPFISRCYDPAQPLLFILRDPVPVLTSDQLWLLSSSQQRLSPKLRICSQVGFIHVGVTLCIVSFVS